VAASDPYAAVRAQLFARLERERSARPDLPTIEELVAEIEQLQPLPAAAQRILHLDESDRFSAHELATIIASDQVLTAQLLRLANSPFYGFGRRMSTVRDAVVLLGFHSVRQVALAGCFIRGERPATHLRYDEFWQFSVATGLLAEMLARTAGQHQGEALTAGVLHNIGLLALDQRRPQVLGEVLGLATAGHRTRYDAEHELLGFTDADLGGALATHWNFPPALAEAVQLHASLESLPAPDSLAAIVMRARLFARAYGLSDGVGAPAEANAASPSGSPASMPSDVADETLQASLDRSGGMERLLERVDSFLGATLG
jgi:HD-like signal output (HDOD) protein